MPERVDELFAEYAAAYARGERPLAGEFVGRAGDEADELLRLIDRYLARAPAPRPDAATVALFEAWLTGESPLARLRTARGLKRESIVAALVKTLRLDPKRTPKVGRYYDELEAGLLEPRRVDRRVWDVLATALSARVSDLVGWKRPTLEFPAAFARASMSMPMGESFAADRSEEPPEEDEIDRLFHADRT